MAKNKTYFRVEYVIHGEKHHCRDRHRSHRSAEKCRDDMAEFFGSHRAKRSPVVFDIVKVTDP